jgi:AcrR family transcriptional regulator
MRKPPQQQRSQVMVQNLIEATARAFDRRGLHLTTRDVAEEAGVSVGSLYQYFKNKDELLAGLVSRMAADVSLVVMRNLPQRLALDYPTFYKSCLLEIVALVSDNPGYRAVARHWHELSTVQAVQTAEQQLMEVARQYMLHHHNEYQPRDLQVSVFVGYNSTVYTVMRYLSLPHPPFGIDRLVNELTEMMSAYAERNGKVAPS